MRPVSLPTGKRVRPRPIASRAVDVADRVVGSVLGLALGDALGAPFEGRRADEVPDPLPALELPWMGLPPGSTTDDTAMARNLVRSLAARGSFDPDDLAARHLEWFRSDPTDVDTFTRRVLSRVDRGEDAFEAARAVWEERGPEVSTGNGSVMYCAPLGLAYADRAEELLEVAPKLSALTHFDERCRTAVLAVTLAVAALADGHSPEGAVTGALAAVVDREGGEELEYLVEMAGVGRRIDGPDQGFCLFTAGVALQSLLGTGHFARGRVRPDVRGIPAAGDGRLRALLMDRPCQRQRRHRDAEPLGDRAEALHPLEVPLEVLRGERPDPFLLGPRALLAPPVVRVEHRVRADGVGQQPEAQWSIGEIADALLGQPRQEVRAIILVDERELVLDRGDRVDRQAPLDPRPVEVRAADGRSDLLGPDPRSLVVGGHLGEDQDLAPPACDGASHQLLGMALTVDLGRIDPIDPDVEDDLHGLDDDVVRGVRSPVRPARLPRAVADHRDLRTVGAEPSCLHGVASLSSLAHLWERGGQRGEHVSGAGRTQFRDRELTAGHGHRDGPHCPRGFDVERRVANHEYTIRRDVVAVEHRCLVDCDPGEHRPVVRVRSV